MRPIAGLTAAARRIADTRDPSLRLPMPETEDEVAELAQTLDQMLRELDAARGETEQMIQAQRDFVADASHELRTPLTSILANLELLEASLAERGADPDEEEIVAGALGSSRRMRRLVADLLLLARADAGRAGPRRPCDLREIAEAALAEVRPVADDHRLELDARRDVEVDGNPDDLHRLVLNLVENGVRHTPPGSTSRRVVSARDGGERSARGLRRWPRACPTASAIRSSRRFVRGNGPADLSTRLRDRPRPGDRQGGRRLPRRAVVAGRSEAGGAKFTVTLPASTESLASLYTPAHLALDETRPPGVPPTVPRRASIGYSLSLSQ